MISPNTVAKPIASTHTIMAQAKPFGGSPSILRRAGVCVPSTMSLPLYSAVGRIWPLGTLSGVRAFFRDISRSPRRAYQGIPHTAMCSCSEVAQPSSHHGTGGSYLGLVRSPPAARCPPRFASSPLLVLGSRRAWLASAAMRICGEKLRSQRHEGERKDPNLATKEWAPIGESSLVYWESVTHFSRKAEQPRQRIATTSLPWWSSVLSCIWLLSGGR
jgi:hypothetical protein